MRNLLLVISMMGILSYSIGQHKEVTLTKEQKQASQVSLEVHDVTGKLKVNIDLGFKQAGNNLIQFTNQNLESGVYFYSLLSDNEFFSGKMVVR